METISGVRSVEFKIEAEGHGVVNWNGSTPLQMKEGSGQTVDNHSLPKLRGYSPFSGKVKVDEESGNVYKYRKTIEDINPKETPLYISRNCLRHHIYKEFGFDNQFLTAKNTIDFLCSEAGLVRGYANPANQNKRTTSLIIEDLVDQLGNLNFEQMGRCGTKEKSSTKDGKEKSNSHFSKTTAGDTLYIGYGSISIEQLQFISLDQKFDNQAIQAKNEKEAELFAVKIQEYLKSLCPQLDPTATYKSDYVRKGCIYRNEQAQAGILLNEHAIQILVDATLDRIKDLVIRQAQGYMYVKNITVDYNDSNRMMRIKFAEDEINEVKTEKYAEYFERLNSSETVKGK